MNEPRRNQREETPIRVLLVDDDERVRKALKRVLGASQGIVVVGTAADGVEALNAAERLNPDVVLMDVKMPRMDGIEATRMRTRMAMPTRTPTPMRTRARIRAWTAGTRTAEDWTAATCRSS